MMNVPKGQSDRGCGEMILYFGCRRSSEDELYLKEIEQMVKEGVISSYYPAYSREPDHKKVKNLIKIKYLEFPKYLIFFFRLMFKIKLKKTV